IPARLELGVGSFERRHAGAFGVVAEIAAIGSRTVLGLLLGNFLEIAAVIKLRDDFHGLILAFHENMAGMDLFRHGKLGDFLVIAGADFLIRDAADDVLLDIGAVERLIAQEFLLLLKFVGLVDLLLNGGIGQKLEVDQRRQECHATLCFGQPAELGAKLLLGKRHVGFRNLLSVKGRNDIVVLS